MQLYVLWRIWALILFYISQVHVILEIINVQTKTLQCILTSLYIHLYIAIFCSQGLWSVSSSLHPWLQFSYSYILLSAAWILSVTFFIYIYSDTYIVIQFSANQHKAFISPYVKIYTQLIIENTNCVPKKFPVLFWQSLTAKLKRVHFIFTFFLQSTFWLVAVITGCIQFKA